MEGTRTLNFQVYQSEIFNRFSRQLLQTNDRYLPNYFFLDKGLITRPLNTMNLLFFTQIPQKVLKSILHRL